MLRGGAALELKMIHQNCSVNSSGAAKRYD